MRDFKQLNVWEKAHRLVLEIYRITSQFPEEERFGLTAQLRRAAASVPSNIAEGCGRGGDRELSRFITIAAGSASEVEYQLRLARDLEYLNNDQHQALDKHINEIKRMLVSFLQKLMAKSSRRTPVADHPLGSGCAGLGLTEK